MTIPLSSRALSGIRWSMVNTIGERVLSFGTTMVLARVLDPEHFGLYALAFVVIDTFDILKNLGLDAALIQRRDRIEEAADTAFLVLPAIGVALFGVLFVCAPRLAALLGNPDVAGPLQALGAVLIIRSLGNVPAALVQRSMRFDLRTAANLSGMVVYVAVAVVLARRGFGVWSLVAAYLIRWLITIVLQWVMVGWVPRWRFDAGLLKDMIHFSKYVVATWLVSVFLMNVDKVSIGRWLGATQLGYYTLCLGLANLMVNQLSVQVYQVSFPAFSQAHGNQEMMRRGLIKVMKYLALCAAPLGVLLMLAPAEVLRAAYGSRWVVAAPMLQVLALGGLLQTLRVGLEPVQLAGGHSKIVFRLNLLQLALLTAGAVSMALWRRPLGVAWAVVVAAAIPLAANLQIVLRQVEMPPARLFAALRPVLGSALVMAGAVWCGMTLRPVLGTWAQRSIAWVLVLAASGGTVYLAALWCWDRTVTGELWRLVRPSAQSEAA